MKRKIKCTDCGNNTFEVHAGPEGERDYYLICIDCGAEIVLDEVARTALREQRKHYGKATS